MPEAVMRQENLTTIIREILVFQQQAHPEMSIGLSAGARNAPAILAQVDAQQVRQALTNVLQNAIDALEGQKVTGETGTIEITPLPDPEGYGIALAVTDNGPGFPQGVDTSRLTEPYVTHREKGTGLGLAIVKKIMDDHKGKIIMGAPEWLKSQPGWNNLGGATIVLVFPHDRVDEAPNGIPAHALTG
jgi:two-component system nitrogen regulation sensor histidine kinase NtrY